MSCKLIVATALAVVSVYAQAPSGRWDATIKIGSLKVPFTMQFEGDAAGFTGFIVNGDARVRSTSGNFDGKTARVEFAQSGARLEATLGDSGLKGTLENAKTGMHPFEASAFCTCGFLGEAGPEIMGSWVSDEGWRLLVRRTGDDTMATLSRDQDEIGPLSGRFNGAFFELSYFDGSRAAVLELEPRKDGTLAVAWMEPGAAAKKSKASRVASQ